MKEVKEAAIEAAIEAIEEAVTAHLEAEGDFKVGLPFTVYRLRVTGYPLAKPTGTVTHPLIPNQ